MWHIRITVNNGSTATNGCGSSGCSDELDEAKRRDTGGVSGSVAMFVHLDLPSSCKSREEELEEARERASARRFVICDDNFLTLLPGDSRVVSMWLLLPPNKLPPEAIRVCGFNVPERLVHVHWS